MVEYERSIQVLLNGSSYLVILVCGAEVFVTRLKHHKEWQGLNYVKLLAEHDLYQRCDLGRDLTRSNGSGRYTNQ